MVMLAMFETMFQMFKYAFEPFIKVLDLPQI